MKVKSLKIATVEGRFVKIGQEFELADKVAAKYIKAGFVEEVVETVGELGPVVDPETPETTKTTKTTKEK